MLYTAFAERASNGSMSGAPNNALQLTRQPSGRLSIFLRYCFYFV
jgi:hypothetical protein